MNRLESYTTLENFNKMRMKQDGVNKELNALLELAAQKEELEEAVVALKDYIGK